MAGQSIVQQWVDVPSGDTLWLQRLDGSTTGSIVVLKDTAPTNDRWNLTVVEIKPSP
jgi:hypothetical protein